MNQQTLGVPGEPPCACSILAMCIAYFGSHNMDVSAKKQPYFDDVLGGWAS